MRSRARVGRLLGAAAVGFVLTTAVINRPADPSARAPQLNRLEDLIGREADRAAGLRDEVAELRADLARRAAVLPAQPSRDGGADPFVGLATGRGAVRGAGLEVTLDDSSLDEAPTGNVNDLVIHSQDVQAVVNALWRAGARAIAINEQRVVATSAVLCVGNTLLLNGTVHSPPFVLAAVGAEQATFDADPLVGRLRADAALFHLGFSVASRPDVTVPAFAGALIPRFAVPA